MHVALRFITFGLGLILPVRLRMGNKLMPYQIGVLLYNPLSHLTIFDVNSLLLSKSFLIHMDLMHCIGLLGNSVLLFLNLL